VHAVVSRDGRPDLAGPELEKVEAPTLLIVGGHDTEVLNQAALAQMHCERELVIIPGAPCARLVRAPPRWRRRCGGLTTLIAQLTLRMGRFVVASVDVPANHRGSGGEKQGFFAILCFLTLAKVFKT
jgi:hypothetical protein